MRAATGSSSTSSNFDPIRERIYTRLKKGFHGEPDSPFFYDPTHACESNSHLFGSALLERFSPFLQAYY